jgi:hypothetical protein
MAARAHWFAGEESPEAVDEETTEAAGLGSEAPEPTAAEET